MEDVVIIKKILQSMTSKYDYMVCSIEESNDLDIVSIDELQSSLLVHKQWISRYTVEEQALQITHRPQQGGRSGGKRKGNIRMEMNGIVQVITEVFFVPELKNNLLSMRHFQEKGLAVVMQHKKCKIYHYERGLLMETEMTGNRIWTGLKVIQRKNMVHGLPQLKAPLNTNLGLFLVEKLEAFASFKSYKARVQKETGAFVRNLRTDRGGDFTSQEFTHFCDENDIQRQLTAAYTPQQNGVAERKNHTIMNMVRNMLSEKQIPKKFWPEAVNWIVHVLNRSPTLAVRSKTPEEAWSGHEPSKTKGGTGMTVTRKLSWRIWNGRKKKNKDYVSGQGLSDEEHGDMVHLALFSDSDPLTYEEAVKSDKWRHAMDVEIKAIVKNNTWELVELPPGVKTIEVKWVFKTKLNENGEVDKYKAQLVAKGYSQKYGLDTIRAVISLVACKSWNIYQLDVKSAFLHGEIDEELFMDQPPGYEQ
ncbi:hypothetical protein ACFX2J_032678 [Malus domestica]